MKLNKLTEAPLGPDVPLPDDDEFMEPSEGNIYAEVPRRRWEAALQSSLMWSVRRITKLIKEKFGLDVVFDKKEFGTISNSYQNSRSGELVFGWKVMDLQTAEDRVKLEAVRTWLASDEGVAEALYLEDFILEPDWNLYES